MVSIMARCRPQVGVSGHLRDTDIIQIEQTFFLVGANALEGARLLLTIADSELLLIRGPPPCHIVQHGCVHGEDLPSCIAAWFLFSPMEDESLPHTQV